MKDGRRLSNIGIKKEDSLGSEMMHAGPMESSWISELVLDVSGSAS